VTLGKNKKNNNKVLLLTRVCCEITVGVSIVGTASSFIFSLSEKPASNCGLFINESAVKWSEQTNSVLLTRSGTSLKIKLIHALLMLGSRGRPCKDCAFPQLNTAQRLEILRGISVVLCCVCVSWAGLKTQWRRSRKLFVSVIY